MRSRQVGSWAALAAILMLWALAPRAWGQAETGQIVGTVQDPTGAAVVGTKVTVKAQSTGVERSQVTNNIGAFTFPNLQPDTYDVTVEATNFATLKQTTAVAVGAKVGLDLKLALGQSSTVVEVSAAAAAVQANMET